jgi:hydrogenase-4 component E
VTGFLAWLLVASGIAVVVVRRRSVVVGIVTVQALVLAVAALGEAETTDDAVAAGALALRGVILAVLFAGVVARTRERVPVHAHVPPLLRGGLAVLLALALVWLVPPIGLETREAERAVLTLIAFGVATAGLRRATILQVLGIVLVENGLALAALELPGAEAAAGIEIGVAIDLTLISIVAIVFHQRIFGLFGAGDTAALRTLRD